MTLATLNLLLVTLGTPSAMAEAVPFLLDDYRWTHRPLLIFAAGADDLELARQNTQLGARGDALADRDMVIVRVVGQTVTVDGRPQQAGAADALRQQFGVAGDAFAAILIGKDGGEKRRSSSSVDLAALFGQIDAMPMRRREMMQQGSTPPT